VVPTVANRAEGPVSSRATWRDGWWRGARPLPSPNHDARPPGEAVTLVIVHSISLPPGEYGGDAVEALFLNRLDADAHPYYEQLRGLRVSAHFFVRRDGRVLQFVSCDRRAWHAGRSHWRGRDDCNHFSIGIELEGLEGSGFEEAQYRQLARLLRVLAARYPLAEAVGHEDVAPGRKADPGPGFDWPRLRRLLRRRRPALPRTEPADPRCAIAPRGATPGNCGEPY
jgi:AmpD protein